MIESSENTMSSTMICRMIAVKPAFAAPLGVGLAAPSKLSWISLVLFQIRNRPPRIRIRSRPETSKPNTVNSGSTRPTIQASTSNRATRMNIAMNKPRRRAISRRSRGNLSTRIEMKMMLSMPSTSSSAVSVANAIQASGESSSSSMGVFRFGARALLQALAKEWSSALIQRALSPAGAKLASKLLRASV